MSASVCLCVRTLTHKHVCFWKNNKVQVSDYHALECNSGSDPVWIYPRNLLAFILLQRNFFETRIYFDWTELKYSILFCVPLQTGMMFPIELNFCLANDLRSHIREKSVCFLRFVVSLILNSCQVSPWIQGPKWNIVFPHLF